MLTMFLRYGYAPLFFAGFIGVALWAVAAGVPGPALSLLLIVAIALSFACERVAPYEPAWNVAHGDRLTDALHAVINEAAIVLSVLALPLVAMVLPRFELWPAHWPLGMQLAAAIVVADLGITLAHVASHRIGLLWHLHAVHHAAPRLYGLNGLMKHPLHQAVELVAGTAPLVLLGMTGEVAWLLAFAVGIQLLLQHSNVDMRIGSLGYVWAVAPAHRHHHLASAREGDVNFGLFLALWDHALGTFVADRPAPRAGDVGVAGRPDYPRGYFDHLAEPFRSARD